MNTNVKRTIVPNTMPNCPMLKPILFCVFGITILYYLTHLDTFLYSFWTETLTNILFYYFFSFLHEKLLFGISFCSLVL